MQTKNCLCSHWVPVHSANVVNKLNKIYAICQLIFHLLWLHVQNITLAIKLGIDGTHERTYCLMGCWYLFLLRSSGELHHLMMMLNIWLQTMLESMVAAILIKTAWNFYLQQGVNFAICTHPTLIFETRLHEKILYFIYLYPVVFWRKYCRYWIFFLIDGKKEKLFSK